MPGDGLDLLNEPKRLKLIKKPIAPWNELFFNSKILKICIPENRRWLLIQIPLGLCCLPSGEGEKMSEMIAYCGLNCTECPALLATRANDEEKAQSIAREWSTQFGVNVTAANVWCDGCLVGGKKCAHCGECEIRACGIEKGVENCAHCAEYNTCGKIQGFFTMAPMAKTNLEKILAKLTT